jgi:hypothetical protein
MSLVGLEYAAKHAMAEDLVKSDLECSVVGYFNKTLHASMEMQVALSSHLLRGKDALVVLIVH